MNKLAIVAVSLFIIIEIALSSVVVYGMPLWLLALMVFTFAWMAIIAVKEKVKFTDV